jgi:uncharacterized protein YodC (DUF2158 family)
MKTKTKTETKPASKPRPIKAGDVVVLKSGSQNMTVTAASGGMATVVWQHFDTKDVKANDIPLIALTRAN